MGSEALALGLEAAENSLVTTDLSVAIKLADAARRAEDPERARRFYLFARSAYLDVMSQVEDAGEGALADSTARDLQQLHKQLEELAHFIEPKP